MTKDNEMDSITSKVIHQFFESGGGSESAHLLVRHQIESYNEFLDKKLQQVIHGFNPIVMCHNYDTTLHEFTQKLSVSVTNPRISKPLFTSQDGAQMVMTPHMARMNNLSYAANMYVDVHVTTEHINQDGVKERTENQMPNICIGKIPIMVRSKACTLQILSGISENLQKQECKFDHGGYFIVNGNEKVIITQDRISENRTLVFPPSGSINESGLTAEVRSMYDGVFLPPKTTSINLSARPNHLGRTLRVNTNFLRSEIPLFILFRALGIESDRDIITHIVLNPDNPKNARLVAELAASAEDASDIGTMEDAQNHILKIMGVTGTPREYMDNPEHAMRILKNVLTQDLLPHVGTSYRRKALYLGYMVRKILRIYLGYDTYDNRDSYIHKRADPPGVLLGNLFRQCYSKMIKEMRNMVQRELHQWRASPQSSVQIINETNVHRFFKSTIVDTGMRYALSTGNWGIKSIGSFTNIRQGVAQVLNRLSYLSTLSHLRRLNTPMEKSGKLVQPRKLDNSQFGMVCPAETPEGSSVGLVKNMALSTQITVACSSAFVRHALKELGTQHYDDTTPNPRKFLLEMGSGKAVHIMVNGDLIGYHTEPNVLYNTLKSYKRKGMIAPTTSIAWDVHQSILMISTEGGRLCRPLYIVDEHSKLRIQTYYEQKGDALVEAPFATFVVPTEKEFEEGCIEFLDMEEINNAMIAMFPKDLKRGVKGVTLPPQFTHCEIHPALMSGVLAANIPFMNHNQSPRNCYQASMGKQAVGVYATNYLSRMDTLGHVLNYGQKPMVRTSLSKYTHSDEMPFGVNAVVAIMTYSGFNQEDSVMINESALDRGLFTSTYYKSYRDLCNRNHSTGEEEQFIRPSAETASKPFRYDKLGSDGFVPKNTYVDGNDIIVGKVMPHKAQGVMTYRDTSMHIKNNEDGIVDENYIGTNNDGYKFCKVRLRCNRRPQIGDKVASRMAQKGTLGMTYKQADMPFTKDGIIPDVIMNPHAIPSRMTMGQLMECLMGKASAMLGSIGDSTPFTDCSVEQLAEILQAHGLERYGNEVLYNGRTGEQIHTEIFIGPTYYQRLKHMTVDKMHSRSSNGPVVMLTRQPAEGRARNGGLRFGKPKLPIKVGIKIPASPTWRGDTVKFRGTLVVSFDIKDKLLLSIYMPEWKIIKNYENYSVSSDGDIKNNNTERLLKYCLRNGYKSITLSKNNTKKTYNIHNIVAEHFLIKPSLKHVVHHKNENKLDNNITNLEYVTYRENTMCSMTSKRSKKSTEINLVNFKEIPNYTSYMICKEGNIYSKFIKRLCCTTILPNGYHKIKLKSDDTKQYKDLYVHVLVAITFLDYIPSKNTVINHKDNRKGNNILDNLEILTHRENTIHYIATKPESIFKRPVEYTDKNGLIIKFKSAKEASIITGIDNSSILKSCKSANKLAGNIKWNYTSNS